MSNPDRALWRSRIGIYAVFLALFSMQAGTALHQEQHRLADLNETCAACLQVDQFGAAITTPVPGIDVSTAHEARPSTQPRASLAAPRPAWYGRAPPAVT